jgi:general secretion pathway protein F
MNYRLVWFDPLRNEVHEDLLEAGDGAQLRSRIDARMAATGGVPLSARAERSTRGLRRRSSGLDVAWWCRELRTLVLAGMTVVEALETLHAQSQGGSRAEATAALVLKLHEGKALSDAMSEVGVFPSVLVASVKASERTSSLAQALEDYQRYDDMLQRLRKQVVSAAIYPAVVVALGAAITLLLLVFVVPRFSQMYRDLRGDLSVTTQILVGISSALERHGALVAEAAIACVVAWTVSWRRGWTQSALYAIAARVEPLQRQIDQYRRAKLYQSLALMFRGGYPLDEALTHCERLGLGSRMDPGIRQARQSLMQGLGVARALGDAGLADAVAARLLAVGERSGNFDRVLSTIGERHAERFTTFVERATRVVEPLLLLLVALVVGGIVLMMYMPVFDIASSIH